MVHGHATDSTCAEKAWCVPKFSLGPSALWDALALWHALALWCFETLWRFDTLWRFETLWRFDTLQHRTGSAHPPSQVPALRTTLALLCMWRFEALTLWRLETLWRFRAIWRFDALALRRDCACPPFPVQCTVDGRNPAPPARMYKTF